MASPVRQNVMRATVITAAVLVQSVVISDISILGMRGDVVALVVSSLALLSGAMWGSIFGFTGGLLLALAVGAEPGLHALAGALIGYWLGRWGEVLVTDEHWFPPLAGAVAAILMFHVGVPIFEVVLLSGSLHGVLGPALGTLLLSSLIALPVYTLVRSLTGSSSGDDTRAAWLRQVRRSGGRT